MFHVIEHSRPFLDSFISGANDTLTPATLQILLQEAAPRLRKYDGPPIPVDLLELPWLVVGSAKCVYDDLQNLNEFGPVIAVNRAMYELPISPDIGVTLHYETTRELANNYNGRLFCSHGTDYVTDVLPVRYEWKNGTSGLYAVQVALHLGAKNIILAGCPIDDSPHFNVERGLARGIPELEMHRVPWREYAPELRARGVRSMSGWTRGLLGGPDDYNI